MVSIENDYKNEIESLFNSEEFQGIELLKRGYVCLKEIQADSILFMGLNPSFTKDAVSGSDFYRHEDAIYSYFKKFPDLVKHTGFNWTHLDLLFIRETNQKLIEKLTKDEIGTKFIWDNLQISRKIIEKSKPKIIVVQNTLARRFLGKDKAGKSNKWLDYDFKFDHNIGTDRIQNKESKLYGVPVFFTSMLTGQRAIDLGSYERLKWHIKFVIDNDK